MVLLISWLYNFWYIQHWYVCLIALADFIPCALSIGKIVLFFQKLLPGCIIAHSPVLQCLTQLWIEQSFSIPVSWEKKCWEYLSLDNVVEWKLLPWKDDKEQWPILYFPYLNVIHIQKLWKVFTSFSLFSYFFHSSLWNITDYIKVQCLAWFELEGGFQSREQKGKKNKSKGRVFPLYPQMMLSPHINTYFL